MASEEKEAYQSGHYERQLAYSYFVPSKISREWYFESPAIPVLLEQASQSLGTLNAFAQFVPSVQSFIQMYVVNESVHSSKIEGTQTSMEEALSPLESISLENRDDWTEVNNYTNALNHAISRLETLPFSSRLIRETHKLLMVGVRGEQKLPGEYRKSQNWIGGSNLNNAVYIPPAHHLIGELMADLENFFHSEEWQVPVLIKAAILHYQFESIHPFLDGNGRVGRLLIILLLIDKGALKLPLLYLSDYLERNRATYYAHLSSIRTQHAIEPWIEFFLEGVKETANNAIEILQATQLLENQLTQVISQHFNKKEKVALQLLQHLFKQPIIKVKDVEEVCQLSPKSAGGLVNEMVSLNILQPLNQQQRNRLFVFKKYVGLWEL